MNSNVSPGVSRRLLLGTGIGLAGAAAWGGYASANNGSGKGRGKGGQGWVRSTLARMTPDEKIGQLFVQEVYGKNADDPDPRNLRQYGVEKPKDVVAKLHLGGVIYFAWTDSFTTPQGVAQLSNGLQQASLKAARKAPVPLQIATDQEMGVVTRFGPPATQFPGSMALGAGRSVADARLAAAITGKELRAVGINVNFAPTSDVNVNPLNPVIGVRAFSSDPTLTANLVAAQVKGYQEDGQVSSSTKHFPGHGDTATDSHYGLPVIDHTREEWERIDAPPFRAAIKAGVDMVMTAHLVMPAFDDSGDPATLSKKIMTGLLRGELGYTGVVITDGLMMDGVREKYGDDEVAVKALEAGVDQLLMAPEPLKAITAIKEALKSGRLTWTQIDQKVERILRLKYRRGMVSNPLVNVQLVDNIVGAQAHKAAADAISDRTVTLVKNSDKVLPLKPAGLKVLVTGWGVTTTQLVAGEFTSHGASASVVETGISPSSAKITAATTAAAAADVVVVLTNKAWSNKAQLTLVERLNATGKKVVVVAVRDPYDLTYVSSSTLVATYSYSPVTPKSLVKVLVGKFNPVGKLPVDLPAPGAPDTVVYPFGHGLGY